MSDCSDKTEIMICHNYIPQRLFCGAQRALVGDPEGKRPLGGTRCRWEGDIKMDIQEAGCGTWTGLIWLRTGRGGGNL